MPEYVVTFTSMVIDAENKDDAIKRAGDFKGGGQWEASEVYRTESGRLLTDADIEAFSEEAERGYDVPPVEFTGVTIQFSGSIPTPNNVSLNAMMDDGESQCSFTITSFAATETEARDNMNQFLTALIAAITPK